MKQSGPFSSPAAKARLFAALAITIVAMASQMSLSGLVFGQSADALNQSNAVPSTSTIAPAEALDKSDATGPSSEPQLPDSAQTPMKEGTTSTKRPGRIESMNLDSVQLSKFEPSSIGRDDVATAILTLQYSFVYAITLAPGDRDFPTRSDLLTAVKTDIQGLYLDDASGIVAHRLDVNSLNVDKYSQTSERSGELTISSQVVVTGSDVPFGTGVFGQAFILRAIVLNGTDQTSSGVQSVRISGLTAKEKMLGVFLALYLLVAGAAGYYWIWRRRRRIQAEGQDMVRADANRQGGETRDVKQEPPLALQPPDVPHQLVEAVLIHNALLCVGPDLSTAAGLPNLSKLVVGVGQTFADDVSSTMKTAIQGLAGTSENAGGPDASLVMEALIARIGRTRVIGRIRELLSATSANLALHRRFAALPWRGVIALTWDDAMHRATVTERSTRDVVRLRPEDGDALKRAINEDFFFVDAFQDAGDLILTSTDFERQLEHNPDYARQLALLLDTSCFLFVGIRPQVLLSYLRAFGGGVRYDGDRHYALVPYSPSNEFVEATLSQFGVGLLEYDPALAEPALSDFAGRIAQEVKRRGKTPFFRKASRPTVELEQIRIDRLELVNIGPFEGTTLDLGLDSPEGKPSQWTVILGPNGAGKSILLKAIALALIPNDKSSRLAIGALLKRGTKEGLIKLHIGRIMLSVELYADRNRTQMGKTSRSTPVEAGHALVIGFPALRGAPSVDPSSYGDVLSSEPQPADLAPLVWGGVDPRMEEFKQWILDVLIDAQRRTQTERSARAISIKQLLDRIVEQLVPGNFVGFADYNEEDGICLLSVDGTSVPLFTVSSGMSSIFNWIGVLIQRLYDVNAQSRAPNEGFAVVLIDEIDVHLHPDWQRRLVDLVKKFFPNVQIIATTHSPLIASSLHRDEIRVLQLDGSILVPAMETYGCSADEIMQSEVGGLRNARPLIIEEKIEEYKELYAKHKPDPDELRRLSNLEGELRKIGWIATEDEGIELQRPSEEQLTQIMSRYKQ